LSTELSNETNPDKIKLLKQDIADVKQKLKDKKGNSTRWQDNDGDGKWYEPGVDVKENVNESFTSRLKKNLIGGSLRK
jgi:hypothetical protein